MTAAPRQANWIDRIARFAASRSAVALVGAWAFGEAIVLPVVPDVALGLLALAAPRRAGTLFAAVLAGAVAGSLVLAVAATAAPRQVEAMLLALPAIDDATFASVDASLDTGVTGFAQVGAGPPLKVYTTEWVEAGGGPIALIAGVVINRLTRIGPIVLVAAMIGWLSPGWLRRHDRAVVVGYGVAWTVFYALYWR